MHPRHRRLMPPLLSVEHLSVRFERRSGSLWQKTSAM
jgi:hypothetical protein